MSKVGKPPPKPDISPELEALLTLADDLDYLAREYPPAADFAHIVHRKATDMVKAEPLTDEGGD